jgi:hypothetical protein
LVTLRPPPLYVLPGPRVLKTMSAEAGTLHTTGVKAAARLARKSRLPFHERPSPRLLTTPPAQRLTDLRLPGAGNWPSIRSPRPCALSRQPTNLTILTTLPPPRSRFRSAQG